MTRTRAASLGPISALAILLGLPAAQHRKVLTYGLFGAFAFRIAATLLATDGRQALELLDGGDKVDLLFSDLIMPGGMNGVMLAREARRRQPRLKVLLTTGYAEASLERTDAGGSEFEIINKPYRRMELARRVRAVLDGPTGVT